MIVTGSLGSHRRWQAQRRVHHTPPPTPFRCICLNVFGHYYVLQSQAGLRRPTTRPANRLALARRRVLPRRRRELKIDRSARAPPRSWPIPPQGKPSPRAAHPASTGPEGAEPGDDRPQPFCRESAGAPQAGSGAAESWFLPPASRSVSHQRRGRTAFRKWDTAHASRGGGGDESLSGGPTEPLSGGGGCRTSSSDSAPPTPRRRRAAVHGGCEESAAVSDEDSADSACPVQSWQELRAIAALASAGSEDEPPQKRHGSGEFVRPEMAGQATPSAARMHAAAEEEPLAYESAAPDELAGDDDQWRLARLSSVRESEAGELRAERSPRPSLSRWAKGFRSGQFRLLQTPSIEANMDSLQGPSFEDWLSSLEVRRPSRRRSFCPGAAGPLPEGGGGGKGNAQEGEVEEEPNSPLTKSRAGPWKQRSWPGARRRRSSDASAEPLDESAGLEGDEGAAERELQPKVIRWSFGALQLYTGD